MMGYSILLLGIEDNFGISNIIICRMYHVCYYFRGWRDIPISAK